MRLMNCAGTRTTSGLGMPAISCKSISLANCAILSRSCLKVLSIGAAFKTLVSSSKPMTLMSSGMDFPIYKRYFIAPKASESQTTMPAVMSGQRS